MQGRASIPEHGQPLSACGIARRLTRALQTFELQPTYGDVMPVESSSVQEYLDQMHEYTTIAAIQVSALDMLACSTPLRRDPFKQWLTKQCCH